MLENSGVITGCDVLDIPEPSSVEVLFNESFKSTGHTNEFGQIQKRPPIDVLFASDFDEIAQAKHILGHFDVEKINVFTVSAPKGILVGQRSLVTGHGQYLINDTNHSNHTYRVFSAAERRDFESLQLLPINGAYGYRPEAQPPMEIGGTAVALTAMEHDNYGAFLLRALPKVISIKELGIRDASFVAPMNTWQSQIFASVGCDMSRFVGYDRNRTYSADNFVLPSMRTSEFFLDDSTRVFFSDISERVSFGRRTDFRYEKLYVSRIKQGLARPDYRLFQNEAALIERLRADGFHIFAPEDHCFEEQVATFNSARIVVGPSGAGMFNTIFCRPGTTVVSLEPLLTWLQLHTNLFSSMGHNYALVLGGADQNDPTVQKRWSTDVDAVMRFLRTL